LSIMRWVGHIARMEERRGSYTFLVGEHEAKRALWRYRSRLEYNIKMGLQGIRTVVDWIDQAQERVIHIKCSEFPDWPRKY
jgi:hypothetical protein